MKVNGPVIMGIALTVAVLASAFALVSVRQLNRMAFYDVLKLERQRDELSIEWRQLMAEYSVWRLQHNVETEVRGELDMEPPSSQRIQTIRLTVHAPLELEQ